MLQLDEDPHLDLETVFKTKEIYEKISSLFPTSVGKDLSAAERKRNNEHSNTLVYGEIKFEPFAFAFEKIKHKYGGLKESGQGVYYDIGSGTGKPVFAAALLHSFKRAVGIEILKSLHDAAVQTLSFWNQYISAQSDKKIGSTDKINGEGEGKLFQKRTDMASSQTHIEFINGDITKPVDIDVSDATLLFANSTCFDDKLMLAVAAAADKCAIGTFFISFTKEIPSSKWMVLESERYAMSWGFATVFIHIKIVP